ncbi:MAG: DUF6489 family protein [Novosphingobium sp.]
MKMTCEVDCTPEEARRFLGLPDVSEANAAYVDAVTQAMKGATNIEQMQKYAKQLAPMGQAGLKLFQQMMESGASAAMASFAKKAKPTE